MDNYWDSAHAEIEKALNGPREVFYSTGRPIGEIAAEGNVRLYQLYDEFWGVDGASYTSEVMQSPTWLEVAVAADEMIRTTKDFHHQFLEGLHLSHVDADGVLVYRFVMGS